VPLTHVKSWGSTDPGPKQSLPLPAGTEIGDLVTVGIVRGNVSPDTTVPDPRFVYDVAIASGETVTGLGGVWVSRGPLEDLSDIVVNIGGTSAAAYLVTAWRGVTWAGVQSRANAGTDDSNIKFPHGGFGEPQTAAIGIVLAANSAAWPEGEIDADGSGAWTLAATTQDNTVTDVLSRFEHVLAFYWTSPTPSDPPPGDIAYHPGISQSWRAVMLAAADRAEVLEVVRQYPRDDGRGLSSAPRLYPPPRARRRVGGYQ